MTNQTAARDFFLHLFSTILLYMGVVSLLTLLFAIINKYVPDPVATLNYYSYSDTIREQARFAIAMLVVVAPVYYWSMRFITKAVQASPKLKEFKPRKWLMYLTIFAAAIIIVITLITVVWRFLNGEATTRFLLKVLSVLIVSAGMFWYYLNEAKDERADQKKYIAWASVVVIVASIIGGFFVMGSPADERARRFDQERISNLQDIQWALEGVVERGEALPASLEELKTLRPEDKTDPETGEMYGYLVQDGMVTLCATFKTASATPVPEYRYPTKESAPIDWSYVPGEKCFELDINGTVVTTFQECVEAGNPVMESYPRQCRHNGVLYVEEIQ